MDTTPSQEKSRLPKVRKARRPRLMLRRALESDSTIQRAEVLAALNKILLSADFPATLRNRRFLEYVVRETLDGRLERINGYYVATQVFGRAPDFNPTEDPIVRVEAAKLRRDLEVYHLRNGTAGEVHISLPRGGYIPIFQRRASSAVQSTSFDLEALTVHALHNGDCALARAEPGFRARVVDALARQSTLAVFAGPAVAGHDGVLDSDAARDLGRRNGTRFVLSGDARPDGEAGVVFTLRLHDGQTGQLLWSEDAAGAPASIEQVVVERITALCRLWAERLRGEPETASR